ncbi:hypothetical protein SNN83_004470 [Cronobacter malonaticus]|nr:hypothetical protein [Cronobacter malonaticus]
MYYFRNIHWGLIIYFIALYLMREDLDQPDVKMLLSILLINSLLFPFAKKAIEKLALKFSTRESWMTGFYTETPMKNGIYAIYYMVIFIVVIPVSVACLLYSLTRKKGVHS